MKIRNLLTAVLLSTALNATALDNPGIATTQLDTQHFTLIEQGLPTAILVADTEDGGIMHAIQDLRKDFSNVCGHEPQISTCQKNAAVPSRARYIIIGNVESPLIQQLTKKKLIDAKALKGKVEKYVMQTISNPLPGVDEALVIAGSDKRGTIYGIYELSEQMGVSPWYYWADTPIEKQQNLAIEKGSYTAGEPAVRYRGIFLNDEAPCLTTWVKNTFGTDFGGHAFYEKVFELILRLRGNFLWPAMWGWAFYADDPENSVLADKMGIIMGTSHHEPMARNHQEWARKRGQYGEWDYNKNQEVIDQFFREGVRRSKNNEDLITIGMRGDGDAAMGNDEEGKNDQANIELLEKIVKNQRDIIAQETGRPAKERQQVWALYKEVQRYYDRGLKVPDDAIILFSDDNWGDIRRLPSEREKAHKGGFGMYYHVDYVGAPRNSKWLNVTPVQHIWDQMTLTYQYGVDKLWVLNVGDLKPMEYPITLFLDMAWDPTRYTASNLLDHTRKFCLEQFGEPYANEAARLLNLYSQYNGRVTPEMLDSRTYNVQTGEWKQVAEEYKCLETDALRLLQQMPAKTHDAYQQLILFPIQAMANLYEMYYAQAMNQWLYQQGNPEANQWADRVEAAFKRDSILCRAYNKDIANGKWDGMMIQKHIGYRSWNDNFRADTCPRVSRFDNTDEMKGQYTFLPTTDYIAMDAEHYYSAEDAKEGKWTLIPYMGRTRSGISVQPYDALTDGASISYRMQIPEGVKEVDVHVITAATLAFKRKEGHRYQIGFDGQESTEVNFNGELNEEPNNVYRVMYPTVASRVINQKVHLKVGSGTQTLTLRPLDPGVVLEKIVIDLGGYKPQHLFGNETPCTRK